MHDSVQTGFRNELALEHIIPVCNGKLAGQDECLPVVPVIYAEEELKKFYKEQKESTTIRKPKKIGRNDLCPCGSGKKYKKCCGRNK